MRNYATAAARALRLAVAVKVPVILAETVVVSAAAVIAPVLTGAAAIPDTRARVHGAIIRVVRLAMTIIAAIITAAVPRE